MQIWNAQSSDAMSSDGSSIHSYNSSRGFLDLTFIISSFYESTASPSCGPRNDWDLKKISQGTIDASCKISAKYRYNAKIVQLSLFLQIVTPIKWSFLVHHSTYVVALLIHTLDTVCATWCMSFKCVHVDSFIARRTEGGPAKRA